MKTWYIPAALQPQILTVHRCSMSGPAFKRACPVLAFDLPHAPCVWHHESGLKWPHSWSGIRCAVSRLFQATGPATQVGFRIAARIKPSLGQGLSVTVDLKREWYPWQCAFPIVVRGQILWMTQRRTVDGLQGQASLLLSFDSIQRDSVEISRYVQVALQSRFDSHLVLQTASVKPVVSRKERQFLLPAL